MLDVFIGYDSREPVAYHVLAHSIMARASRPVSISSLSLTQLPGVGYTRPRGGKESTEFSISRFLVPWLCGYEGYAIFMDCDFLCRTNIWSLVDYHGPTFAGGVVVGCVDCPNCTCEEKNDLFARKFSENRDTDVWVCQHDYVPTTTTKFLGQSQLAYPKKNWSSLMVFNNARCRQLTPEYVSEASGLELHRFEWAKSVGSIPLSWNWLVGEYAKNPDADMVHFTLGGPWFPEYASVDYAEEWRTELHRMMSPKGVA